MHGCLDAVSESDVAAVTGAFPPSSEGGDTVAIEPLTPSSVEHFEPPSRLFHVNFDVGARGDLCLTGYAAPACEDRDDDEPDDDAE